MHMRLDYMTNGIDKCSELKYRYIYFWVWYESQKTPHEIKPTKKKKAFPFAFIFLHGFRLPKPPIFPAELPSFYIFFYNRTFHYISTRLPIC